MENQLSFFDLEDRNDIQPKVVNVSSVPQRSPFRYPGGKTWLVPIVRKWLKQEKKVTELIEPFAGGAIVSLTAAFENLASHITMAEIDDEIAAVWDVILSRNNSWLANKIVNFELTQDNVNKELNKPCKEIEDIAFCTILKNRIFHGGILAKGSGLIKNGENGKGIASRWYPTTLKERITSINMVQHKISFFKSDAFRIIEKYLQDASSFFFIDPPYTIAGKRLYTHFDIDHERLFELTAQIKGKFMLTYDDTNEIRMLAEKHSFDYRFIPMKTTHHQVKNELIISDNFDWYD
jgi:DNA adenine methylase